MRVSTETTHLNSSPAPDLINLNSKKKGQAKRKGVLISKHKKSLTSVSNVVNKSHFKQQQQKIWGTEKHISNRQSNQQSQTLDTSVESIWSGILKTMINMLKALIEKVGSMQDQMGKFSREMEITIHKKKW